jgi:hypothetical protein
MVDHLLRATAKALQQWSDKAVGNIKFQILVTKEVIFRLEAAQDTRSLSVAEAALRWFLKIHYLGLTSLERTMARQRSSMQWLHEGDANTKFFQLHANHRRRRNHIGMLEVEVVTLVAEEEKAEAGFNYFSGILGTDHDKEGRLNFEALGIHRRDISSLGCPFAEEEIWAVIKELPLDKAPWPDGFTGRFYRFARLVIKRGVIRAFDAFSSMDCRSFHHLNDVLLILLPKSPDPMSLGDYRPISLIHSFGKKIPKH